MFQFYALDSQTNRPADSMHITINGNLFRADLSTSDPKMIGWGGSDNHTVTVYRSAESFEAAKGPSWHNAEATPGITSAAATPAAGGYAVPLPTDVAAALSSVSGLAGFAGRIDGGGCVLS